MNPFPEGTIYHAIRELRLAVDDLGRAVLESLTDYHGRRCLFLFCLFVGSCLVVWNRLV